MALRDVLDLDDCIVERVDVPEWAGHEVYVRTMDGLTLEKFQSAKRTDAQAVRAELAAFTVCDKDGVLQFTPEDVPALSKKSGPALYRIFEAASKLNRLRKEDLEETEKNSDSGQS